METNNETVEQVFSSCENVMVWDFPGGPMEYARRFLAAHKRELAAKDEEIAKRDALIKELADALNVIAIRMKSERGCSMRDCSKCKFDCGYIPNKLKLVAKAREVLNG